MDIHVYTDTKSVSQVFGSIKGGKDIVIAVHPSNELKKTLKEKPENFFIYMDISSFAVGERSKILKSMGKTATYSYGIIDPACTIKDPAVLFFNGASDYMGKDTIKGGIDIKRIREALSYKQIIIPDNGRHKNLSAYILSGNDWQKIKDGKEYTFCLMFIELDNKKDIRSLFGGEQLDDFLEKFQRYIQNTVTPHQGKIWMWQEWGGLVLFPFDGESCEAILDSIRLMMNRNIFSAEIFSTDIMVSFRIALHLGNTIYKKRGDTGNIISDAVNSVFHLGQKFADPENFFMVESLVPYIPKGLEKLFIPAGDYEGRNIVRMRRPIY